MGFWKTMRIRVPRTRAISASSSASRSLPSNRTSPAVTYPGGDGMRRRTLRQSTDLPLPDSPTMPRVLPFETASETAALAKTVVSRRRNSVTSPRTSRTGPAGAGAAAAGRDGAGLAMSRPSSLLGPVLTAVHGGARRDDAPARPP